MHLYKTLTERSSVPFSSSSFSAGYTDDIRCALAYVSKHLPDAPLVGVGFSLGANVLAKYFGEEGDATPLKGGAVLGCPWDLYKGHIELGKNLLGWTYSKAMARNLRSVSLSRPLRNRN
jgi:predicted alpha/beta-fold hydrolase